MNFDRSPFGGLREATKQRAENGKQIPETMVCLHFGSRDSLNSQCFLWKTSQVRCAAVLFDKTKISNLLLKFCSIWVISRGYPLQINEMLIWRKLKHHSLKGPVFIEQKIFVSSLQPFCAMKFEEGQWNLPSVLAFWNLLCTEICSVNCINK